MTTSPAIEFIGMSQPQEQSEIHPARGRAADIPAGTGVRDSATALIGTPRHVAQAFPNHHALGVANFLVGGFDPLADAIADGPNTRALLAERAARAVAAD